MEIFINSEHKFLIIFRKRLFVQLLLMTELVKFHRMLDKDTLIHLSANQQKLEKLLIILIE